MAGQLFDLPIHHTSRWIFNCYIVGDSAESLVLIDPGLPSVATDALEMAGRVFGEGTVPVASVSTHAHSDHVGGVPTVLAHGDTEAYLPGRCEKYLAGEKPRGTGIANVIRFLPVLGGQKFDFATSREFAASGRKIGYGGPKMLTIPFEPAGFLSEGQDGPAMEGWTVIEAPGHTDDSICLYHADTATLLSGDAVVTLDGRAWFNPEWVDTSLAAETEERLRGLEVRHLLPGHGHPIEATDVWNTAMSFRDRPEGKGILARCSRRIGRWNY